MSKKVIIVEDDLLSSTLLEMILMSHGYDVINKLTSFESVPELIQKESPDIILMDIMILGDIDGLEGGRIIRKTSSIPIVFLSALNDSETLAAISKIPNAQLLVKPYEPERIIGLLKSILEPKSDL